jgi:hypothetical protein
LATGLLAAAAACNGSDHATGTANATHFVEHWNKISVDASGLDHTPSDQGPAHTFGQQVGPCRAARAMAIVHVAIFEAVNAILGGYQSYIGLPPAPPGASLQAAIGRAAHDTLAALFPSQSAIMQGYLAEDVAVMGSDPSVDAGAAVGAAAAARILDKVRDDGSDHPEPRVGVDHLTSDQPGRWRQDPISRHPLALGARWSEVRPFVLSSASQFRVPAPPALTSPEYALAFDEVKVLGGDGVTTLTRRDAEQTFVGTYWAYDGVPSLCAPPRLYNQIAMQIANERGTSVLETARLLALINVAMCDAGIASWESKYFWDVWRPVTAIREADAGTGPSGLGDGNPATVGDPSFSPLGAPASNLAGPNFTPPFPAYPSGHATFGGALFQTLRRFYGTDAISFTFVSDEYNGVTAAVGGEVRPLIPRTFENLTQAEQENGQSRIYLGIHWHFDKDEGIVQGRKVADLVFDTIYRPVQ